MASRLLRSGLTALFVMTSCIVPPDLRFVDPPPGQRNRPPRILPDTVRPSEPYLNLARECQREFTFFVEDPDPGDTLRFCTYLDFDPNTPACFYGQTDNPPASEGRQGPVPYSFTILPSDPRLPLNALGTHVIEAYVTDGDLGPDRQPESDGSSLPDGGSSDPRYYDKWVWVVNVEDRPCGP